MTNARNKARAATLRKFAVFIALSLLAHLMLGFSDWLQLPSTEPEPPPLIAKLEPAPEPPALPKKPKPPKPKTEATSETPALTAPKSAEAIPPTDTTKPPEEKTEPALPPVARALPHDGQLSYTLYLGKEDFARTTSGRNGEQHDNLIVVGKTMHQWHIDADHYEFHSYSQTTGIAELFASQRLTYDSKGDVVDGLLHPRDFAAVRVRRGKTDTAIAHFDWDTHTLTYSRPQSPKTAPLPAYAQDLMSSIFQLGLLALNAGHSQWAITDGWKFDTYEIEIGAPETIQTPMGALDTIPVRQVPRADKASVAIWFAPAYRMLPVRIRFFDKDGVPRGEQVINDIRVSNE